MAFLKRCFCIITLLLFMSAAITVSCRWTSQDIAFAHPLSTSYATIMLKSDSALVTLSLHLDDLALAFHIDRNEDRIVSEDELRVATPRIHDFLRTHTQLQINGLPVTLEPLEDRLAKDAAGQEFLELTFHATSTTPVETVSFSINFFEVFGQQHTTLVKIVNGDHIQQAVLSLQLPSVQMNLEIHRPLLAQLGAFTSLGVHHILSGYDHLLFLFALLLVGGRLRSLVKIVTAFTIAHSVTLILAALQLISLPSRLVESGIALTIVYVAAENVFGTPTHRWRLTFFFGLIHGCGFAGVLRELGLPRQGLVASLLAFNVGIEIGQLAVVLLCVPLFRWLSAQRFSRPVTVALSLVIGAAAALWFIRRAFGLSLSLL